MKFTGELKKKLEAAASKEEAHKLLNDVGLELTDEELESVAGGAHNRLGGGDFIPLNVQPNNDQLDANPPIYANKK